MTESRVLSYKDSPCFNERHCMEGGWYPEPADETRTQRRKAPDERWNLAQKRASSKTGWMARDEAQPEGKSGSSRL